jgi:hypothetical protein
MLGYFIALAGGQHPIKMLIKENNIRIIYLVQIITNLIFLRSSVRLSFKIDI